MKSKELSIYVCNQIVSRSSHGYNTLSKALNIPMSTVSSISVKWRKFGTTRTLKSAGHLANVSNRARTAFVREVTKNPTGILTELLKSLVEMGEHSG